MSVYSTIQNGLWSDPGTWGEVSDVPGDGDTVTVGHVVTVDADVTVGHSPGNADVTKAVTITSAGHLVIDGPAVLTIRGDVIVNGGGQITGNNAGVLEFDASQAVDAANTHYVCAFDGGSSLATPVRINGTAINRFTIRSNVGGGNARFTAGSFRTDWIVEYADFLRIGTSSSHALDLPINGSSMQMILRNCQVMECGRFRAGGITIHASANFEYTNVTFRDSLGSRCVDYNFGGSPTGTRLVTGCVFDKEASFGANLTEIKENIFLGELALLDFTDGFDLEGNLIASPSGTPVIAARLVANNYFLHDHQQGGATTILESGGERAVTVEDCVFEATHTSETKTLTAVGARNATINDPQDRIVRRCVALPRPNDAGGIRIVENSNNASHHNLRWAVENNTGCVGNANPFVNISTAFAGVITSLKSNIAWSVKTGSGDRYLFHDGAGSLADVLDAADTDSNCTQGLLAGSAERGYNALFTGTPGLNDLDFNAVNPDFVDPTRNLAKWYRSLKTTTGTDAGDRAAALAELAKRNDSDHDANFTVANLLDYVREGFRPQAVALLGAAHDGTDIGAVPMQFTGDYGIAPPSPAQGLPGLTSGPFTVELASGINPGSVTITPQVSGITGTFDPTSVTLTDTERSATFTFTPGLDQVGTATISATNNGTLDDPDPVTYEVGYLPLSGLPAFEDNIAHGQGYPEDSNVWVNGTDHYDPIRVFQNVRQYTEDASWDTKLDWAIIRYRDAYARTHSSIPGFHHTTLGLRRHYEAAGDELSRLTAIMLRRYAQFSADLSTTPEHYRNREAAWALESHLNAMDMGYPVSSRVHGLAEDGIGHIDQWTAPEGQRIYGIYVRPFMVGITIEALIAYWDKYRDSVVSGIPAKIKTALDWIWEHVWMEDEQAFSYTDVDTRAIANYDTNVADWAETSTTQIRGGSELPDTDGYFVGGRIQLTQTALSPADRVRTVTAYEGATRTFTLAEPLTEIPATGQRFAVFTPFEIEAVNGTDYTLADHPELSSQDDHYLFSPFQFLTGTLAGASTKTIRGYTGSTRTIHVTTAYDPAPSVGDKLIIIPHSFDTGGIFAANDLSNLVGPAYAWYYQYTVNHLESRDNLYRERHDAIFNGSRAVKGGIFGFKEYNQLYRWPFDGLKWRDQGDNPWTPATALTWTALDGAAGPANKLSGRLRVALDGSEVSALNPVEVTFSDGGAGGTFLPATAILTTDRSSITTRYRPAAGSANSSVNLSITNNGGLSNPSAIAYNVGVAATVATTYEVNGPSSGPVGDFAGPFEVQLPTDTVLPPSTDTEGGLIYVMPVETVDGVVRLADNHVFDSHNGLRRIPLSDHYTSDAFYYQPTSEGAETFEFRHVDDTGDLTDPDDLSFNATSATDPATSYTLSGPDTGPVGEPSSPFTVQPNGLFTGTITPSDGGAGGTFTPPSLSWSGTAEAKSFTYMPATGGTKTISTTNDQGLTDPPALAYEVIAIPQASGYSLEAPSPANGPVGVASGAFTVALTPTGTTVSSPVVVTPSDGNAGGVFSPAQVSLSESSPSATFTYIPSAQGKVTISCTNDGSLVNSEEVFYNVTGGPKRVRYLPSFRSRTRRPRHRLFHQ